MVLKKQKCPCCNKEISFSKIFSAKNDLEYYCDDCHNVSYIKMDKKIYNLVIALIALCVIIVFVFSFVIRMLFLGAIIIILLFLGFYLLVPNFLKLSCGSEKQKRQFK
ncbi:MAG: hypothetical protein RUMPE_00100 [Eubacteriales bacterium SKADARSKE-1]|nr:hypothetical protein [Eubacteriales bacterium SKADARSKE-1]